MPPNRMGALFQANNILYVHFDIYTVLLFFFLTLSLFGRQVWKDSISLDFCTGGDVCGLITRVCF